MPIADLYWIDDSSAHMSLFVENVFPLLWDKDLSCATILFGNDYIKKSDEHGPTEQDRNEFLIKLKNVFTKYCEENDDAIWVPRGTTYQEKKEHLLTGSEVKCIPLEGSTEGTDPSSINAIVRKWSNPEKLKELKEKLKPDSVPESLNELGMSIEPVISQMDIPANAVIALDICLLQDDTPHIKQELPTISMALCKELSKNHAYYLYSSLTVSQTTLNQWITTYQEVFQAENIQVFSKEDLLTKRKDTTAKSALMEILRKHKEGAT